MDMLIIRILQMRELRPRGEKAFSIPSYNPAFVHCSVLSAYGVPGAGLCISKQSGRKSLPSWSWHLPSVWGFPWQVEESRMRGESLSG